MVNLIMLHMLLWIRQGSRAAQLEWLHVRELCVLTKHKTFWFSWVTKLIICDLDSNIQQWSKYRRDIVLPYHSWEQQNNGVSGHWPCRIPSIIPFDWPSSQHNMVCPSKCSLTNSVSCNSKRYVPIFYRKWVNLISLQADRKYNNDIAFQKFKHQMYHNTIHKILSPLKLGMMTPVIWCCPDNHFHWVIYNLAAYITDYPEQVYSTLWELFKTGVWSMIIYHSTSG